MLFIILWVTHENAKNQFLYSLSIITVVAAAVAVVVAIVGL